MNDSKIKESENTQTDTVLQELREELAYLSQKVFDLEKNKANKTVLYQELYQQHSIINDLRSQYEKQAIEYKENIKIAAKMLSNIKEPIYVVTQSLKKLASQTDKPTKDAIENCLLTLTNLINQCTESSSYFDSLLEKNDYTMKNCYIEEILQVCNSFKIYSLCNIDFTEIASQKLLIKLDLIQKFLLNIFEFLEFAVDYDSKINITIKTIYPQVSLNNELNLNIIIDFTTKQPIFWKQNWQDSIGLDNLNNNKIPLGWYKLKKDLNYNNGDLFIEEKDKIVKGVSLTLPFSYPDKT